MRTNNTPPSCAPTSTAQVQKGDPDKQALGRSKGGLSTRIHATFDALGNQSGFLLMPRQAHDLKGTDVLLNDTSAQTVIADKAYDAQVRLTEPLLDKCNAVVIPSRVTNKQPRELPRSLQGSASDRELLRTFEAVPGHRYAPRKNSSQLPGRHPSGGIHGVVGLSGSKPITPSDLIDDTP